MAHHLGDEKLINDNDKTANTRGVYADLKYRSFFLITAGSPRISVEHTLSITLRARTGRANCVQPQTYLDGGRTATALMRTAEDLNG